MAPFSERDSKCQINEQQGGLDESQLQEFFYMSSLDILNN